VRWPQNTGGGGGVRQGRFISFGQINYLKEKMSSLKMAQVEKKGKTKYYFCPHTKSQSTVFTRFHYAPRTKKSFVAPKIKNNLNFIR
jgi:hypothetical protein